MQRERAEVREIADYVASMLDELAELSKPLQDVKLLSMLSVSADLARAHQRAVGDTADQNTIAQNAVAHDVVAHDKMAEEAEPRSMLWDQILPARHKPHARISLKPKRLSRAMR